MQAYVWPSGIPGSLSFTQRSYSFSSSVCAATGADALASPAASRFVPAYAEVELRPLRRAIWPVPISS